MNYKSFNFHFTLPRSNFMSGFGSVLGIGGNYYRYNKPTGHYLSPRHGLRSTWVYVGRDIQAGLDAVSAVQGKAGFSPAVRVQNTLETPRVAKLCQPVEATRKICSRGNRKRLKVWA